MYLHIEVRVEILLICFSVMQTVLRYIIYYIIDHRIYQRKKKYLLIVGTCTNNSFIIYTAGDPPSPGRGP